MPPPVQTACLVNKSEACWFWRAVEGKANGLRDPSALPADPKLHEERIRRKLWGPKWARLCPGRLQKINGKKATVEDLETRRPVDVPASMLLPLYEGLLVLDAVSKMEPKVPWLTDGLVKILESERAKYKANYLSAYLYATSKLPNIAVTGPQFFGATGSAVSHRRQIQSRGPPAAESEVSEGWYSVQGLADYLPPWEAFLHPKCGVYQDFYMVQWGPPHNKTDFSHSEHGSETMTGATWEPDECLPEDLDSLRLIVKRRWADQQREREVREREHLERERRERDAKVREQQREESIAAELKRRESSGLEDVERPSKAARKYNPMRLSLLEDVSFPQVRHGLHNMLRSTEDAEIKKGWPKSADEYPRGFGPADPPGCCGSTCDCMEDWHLGRKSLDAGRPWVDTPLRSANCEAVVLNFTGLQEHVMRRGTVSGMHYLEATTDRHKRADVAQVAFAAGFAKLARSVLRDASQRIPLPALTADAEGSNPGCLLRRLAIGFASDEVHPEAGGPFVPVNYQATTPTCLRVDQGTGQVTVVGDTLQANGQALQLSLMLPSMVQPASLPPKFDRMECGVDVSAPVTGDSTLHGLTSKVVAKVPRLEPPAFQEMIKERLSPIYSFEETACLEVPFNVWVEAMWSASVSARAVSVGQLIPRSPPDLTRLNGHNS